MSLHFEVKKGSEITSHLEPLGLLRIQVFKDWPYLYEGDLEYERHYLQTYVHSARSFIFLAYDNENLVGATTAIALEDETVEVQKPFKERNLDLSRIVYFGESILLPPYRGQGLGKRFMQERLNFAETFPKTTTAAFCAVIRDPNDVRKPPDARPLDPFWRSMGFSPVPGFTAEMSWKDIGEKDASKKKLQFWTKAITKTT